ncbi:MAG: hypothetical protein JNK58_04120 [Phycisphaerae bacterium]|nr:hypothetical protein [Phycisphaerae bacterium]
MARAATVMSPRLARRMCLCCGFDGRAIQNDSRETEWACPRCGSDLYARPPKSYAELEALSDSNPGSPFDEAGLRKSARPPRLALAMYGLAHRPLLARVVLAVTAAGALFALGVWLGRMF